MDRAVIYCRVSTEEEKQINALESQIKEARNAVYLNEWLLIDEYIDEGKSGTMTKFRDEFNRLSDDIETSKFDIIVVKSQDRLMRSTKDWYIFVDKVVQNKKKLYFYIENKFYDTDDALLTGIRAILAEEYSRELSKKLNNAHRHRQKNKGAVILTSNTWGYDKIGKEIVINESEAKMVRMIYELCANDYGTRTISKILANKGYVSRTGKPFPDITVRDIIRNPLFKGTAIMNRIHFDFNTKKSIVNDESEWIYKENAVPPIVDEKLWQIANEKMDQRSMKIRSWDDGSRTIGKNSGKFPLSSKIICGLCGSTYWIRRYYRKGKEPVKQWTCSQYLRHGRLTEGHCPSPQNQLVESKFGCDNIHINFDDLNNSLLEISKRICTDKNTTKNNVMNILRKVLNDNNDEIIQDLNEQLATIQKKQEVLLDAYLDKLIDESLYARKEEHLSKQKRETAKKLSEEIKNSSGASNLEYRLANLEKEIENIIDYDVALDFVYRHIKIITVYPDKLNIEFDIFPECVIKIEQINYRKRNFILSWDN